MQVLTEKLYRSDVRDVFSDLEVKHLLGSVSAASRHGLVKRALASGEIIRIRRGLYVMAEPFRKGNVSLLALAHKIYPTSYVSLESALSEHGWIPEQVEDVTCGTFRRSATFETPMGRFVFRHTPFRSLVGVGRIEPRSYEAYLLATPLRALADLAHDRKELEPGVEFLTGSLRMDPDDLDQIDGDAFDALLEDVKKSRSREFLCRLREELDR